MSRVCVHLVSWNGVKYIPHVFASLRAQTHRDISFHSIDNGSVDGTADAIAQELEHLPFLYDYTRLPENIGFAAAHNQLMRSCAAPLVLLLNQDMYVMPDHIARLVACMAAHPDAGACMGRLMRWRFAARASLSAAEADAFTPFVDSLGLQILRSRRVVDWHTGKSWDDVAQVMNRDDADAVEVFGIPGSLPMYRRSAVEAVLIDGCMFDETYFSYKEDVDLAWRLQWGAWRSYLVPDAVAYHDRTAAGPQELTDRAALANREGKSQLVKYHSYKNHLCTLIKNEAWYNYARDWPWIELYEWKKFFYTLFCEFRTWIAIFTVLRLLPNMLRKRAQIMRMRRVHPRELRKWWMNVDSVTSVSETKQ